MFRLSRLLQLKNTVKSGQEFTDIANGQKTDFLEDWP